MIANYTTTVEPQKTVQQINLLLHQWRAEEISQSYDPKGQLTGVGFIVSGIPYRLTCDYEGVYRRLSKDADIPRRFKTLDQARRVAWRILHGWLKYNIEVTQSGLFEREAILMPHRLAPSGETMWEAYRVKMLPGGK